MRKNFLNKQILIKARVWKMSTSARDVTSSEVPLFENVQMLFKEDFKAVCHCMYFFVKCKCNTCVLNVSLQVTIFTKH